MPAKIELTGQRFGRLVAEQLTQIRGFSGELIWKCQCNCGNTTFVPSAVLRKGATKSCGCLRREHAKSLGQLCFHKKDITGQRFGRLVALEPTSKRRWKGSVVWRCRCDCGSEVFICQSQLGKTKSCGCLRTASARNMIGQQYGRLTVLGFTRRGYMECLCECGGKTFVRKDALRKGFTKSCGCLADAALWSRNTNIDSMDVPFEVTNIMKIRRELKKAIKQAS